VVPDDLIVIDGDVRLGGGQRLVSQQLGDDVHRQPGGAGLGAEDAPEVVRGEPDRSSIGTHGPGGVRRGVQQLLDPQGG
jgi:hypothetical protein